jgi:hypothetical protein
MQCQTASAALVVCRFALEGIRCCDIINNFLFNRVDFGKENTLILLKH